MTAELAFKTTALVLGGLFVYFGMDVRRKRGARNFVPSVWLVVMKVASFGLIAAFVWLVLHSTHVAPSNWASLALLASGTACVIAAKRALGVAHTFTGQYLCDPALVTDGIYRLTRNPLYLGVFQCEVGALVYVCSQAPLIHPAHYPWWVAGFMATLLYVVSFNLQMAVREAHFLEGYFGEQYRRYRSRVPFLIPFSKSSVEVGQ